MAVALLTGPACATVQKPAHLKTLAPADLSKPADWEYKIQIGDQLDVKFYFNNDLNEHVVVRPDGRISLQLVPEVMAAGLTARELTDKLKQDYSRELSNPELTVIVRTFSAQRIFVGGEVAKGGEKPLVGSVTALQAVAMAEGFKDSARLTEVVVIRRNIDRTPLAIPINLKAAISGVDPSQDISLLPYDVVWVPKSTLANINKYVNLIIWNNVPISFGFRLVPQDF
ncbi:MAG TPA: polysaccharide biosynthesis/export family protein [Vicinamibacteria bacterium]|nr:polysaccharide biosynthesis/export family protein [Vicinamibacteria bacterium]